MIWLVLIPMLLVAAAGVVLPLLRPPDAEAPRPRPTLGRRLDQIERQHGAGELSDAETDALKLETQRRLLAEARKGEEAARPLSARGLKIVAVALGVTMIAGGAGLYALLGRPDLAATETVATPARSGPEAMIAALEAQVRETPDDVGLLALLGESYSGMGRHAEAAEAFGRASLLAPDNAALPSARGEALVQAAGGRVTDAAEIAFRAAVALNPEDARARYFLALRKDQTGDRDGAMDDWIALLNSAPPDAPWLPQVRGFVEQVAAERGIDISDRLNAPAG
ncbi:c-type cytochrome biogenesis protein CcmI [Brevundimonas sp.]|uniref:c-type cytochrome biogenesis protein CcmI n=1 Tax=Brevundimonas sp. TaxID=1871086 RepID=UPI0025FBB299|nr:c-type cytochrome biogenesis protein CcmI [Brevundimonas sp.]